MIIMVGNGAQAGALAVRADRRDRKWTDGEDRAGRPRVVYLLDQSRRACRGRIWRLGDLRGLALFKSSAVVTIEHKAEDIEFDRSNLITILVIAALLIGVLFFGVNVGMGAFAGAVILASALPITRTPSSECRGRSS